MSTLCGILDYSTCSLIKIHKMYFLAMKYRKTKSYHLTLLNEIASRSLVAVYNKSYFPFIGWL